MSFETSILGFLHNHYQSRNPLDMGRKDSLVCNPHHPNSGELHPNLQELKLDRGQHNNNREWEYHRFHQPDNQTECVPMSFETSTLSFLHNHYQSHNPLDIGRMDSAVCNLHHPNFEEVAFGRNVS
jgi:hypothetical protein